MCLIKRYIVFECSMTKSELINCILQKMDKAMDPVRAQGAVNQILEYLAGDTQREKNRHNSNRPNRFRY